LTRQSMGLVSKWLCSLNGNLWRKITHHKTTFRRRIADRNNFEGSELSNVLPVHSSHGGGGGVRPLF
jgi:hypothetical protein